MSKKIFKGNKTKINLGTEDITLLFLHAISEEKGNTFIHCSYISKPKYIDGGWINIWPTTYLFHKPTGAHIMLLHAINIPLGPAQYHFGKAGQRLNFTLIFPVIPKNWQHFTLKEIAGSASGFIVEDLARNSSGIYRVALQ